MEDSVVLERPSSLKRPAILDTIEKSVEATSRREELTKQKRAVESKLMEQLANIRLQESVVRQKQEALDERTEVDEDPEVVNREKALDSATLVLEDLYQGGVALSEELEVVNSALKEFEDAGMVNFNKNRAGRRSGARKKT